MSKYLSNLLNSEEIFRLEDRRTIITDRMGPWSNQNLTLVWETASGKPCVTPEEAEVLFDYGKLSNVQRDYAGKLYMETTFCDIRTFDGAIVCGTLYPGLHLREEILEYAKSKGYITEKPVDVQMFNGTKSLSFDAGGTYKITYIWSEKIKREATPERLYHFTKKYFEMEFQRKRDVFQNDKVHKFMYYSNPRLEITQEGFSIDNLLDWQVFRRENIDAIREYDLQIGCLSTKIDKNLLLKGLIQLGFACDLPENLRIKYNASIEEKSPSNYLPLFQYSPKLSKDNKSVVLGSGIAVYSYSTEFHNYTVSYKLTVPYSEYVRCLMKNFETLMKKTYETNGCYVGFSPFTESVYFNVSRKEEPGYSLCSQFEKEIVTLDYAISILQRFNDLNNHQLFFAIMRFYASDTNFPYTELFSFYYSLLESKLSEK